MVADFLTNFIPSKQISHFFSKSFIDFQQISFFIFKIFEIIHGTNKKTKFNSLETINAEEQ